MIANLFRARLTVEQLRDDLVCVREHRGNRIEIETFAVRGQNGLWHFDQSGKLVDERTLRAIERAS